MEFKPEHAKDNKADGTAVSFFRDKRVLVTGACGSVGRELVRQLLETHGVGELVGVDNNESELFFLEQDFIDHPNSQFYLADIRDEDKLSRMMEGVDIVFHTAAFKHVILCERSPMEAVRTNIIGVQNLISSALRNKVERVIFTSSDKAVNPTNVMGASKLMAERLMSAANSNVRGEGPLFTSTRFGNVLGSRGSVIPIFHEQIRTGNPVTLTDPKMTRFIMSIKKAVHLVIDSSIKARGGEIFITKMPAVRIKDLAEVMVEELAPLHGRRPEDIEIKQIGVKPGEKMYEELMNIEETRRAWELKRYFVVLPAFRSVYHETHYEYDDLLSDKITTPYHSGNEEPLARDELREFLRQNRLFEEEADEALHPAQRYWPKGV